MSANPPHTASISGEFISPEEAAILLESYEQVRLMKHLGMSVHWLEHETQGSVVLVQGSNGEFAKLVA